MILPDLLLPSWINQRWRYSGIDSLDKCFDKEHFLNYPYPIEYVYNSRGFRDAEWPNLIEDLASAVWCLGDSFTVGLGVPWTHTWPQQFNLKSSVVTINISMDGASNDWLARTALKILQEIGPVRMAIMWSFLHRRESTDTSLSDQDRRLQHDRNTIDLALDFENFSKNFQRLQSQSRMCHMLIPRAYYSNHRYSEMWNKVKGPDWPQSPPDNLSTLPRWVKDECVEYGIWPELTEYQPNLANRINSFMKQNQIHQIHAADLGRDGLHFDIKTAQHVADLVWKDLLQD